METKQVRFELKEVTDKGRIVGLSAVYNTRDYGGDVIMPGAFSKTLEENGGKFPLFYAHKVNIGVSSVEDRPEGLLTEGRVNLETLAGREIHSNVKFYKENGLDFGMSIGYLTIPDKTEYKAGTRYLKEVKLFENTLTELPLNAGARVRTVKGMEGFDDALEVLVDLKEGRKISRERSERLRSLASEIFALLEEAGAIEATTSTEAAPKSNEPDQDHSKLESMIAEMRSYIH